MILRLRKQIKYVIKWHSREKINTKSAAHVVVFDDFEILDLVSSNRMIERGPELNENIEGEDDVDQRVQD